MIKVVFNEETLGYRTMGHLRRVNFTDKEMFIEYIIDNLGLVTESYTENPVNKIIFTYIIKDGLSTDKDRALLQDLSDKSVTTQRFNNMNIPISMNINDYGTIRSKTEMEGFIRYIVSDNRRVYEIDVTLNEETNNVSILGPSDLKWTDRKSSEGEGFIRSLGKSTY